MTEPRQNSASTLDENGNMWVIGGLASNDKNQTDNSISTEVYEYRIEGTGVWKKGYELPSILRDTGIQSHCVVKINTTHVFMAGGFADVFKNCDTLADQVEDQNEDVLVSPRLEEDKKFCDSTDKGDLKPVDSDNLNETFSGGGLQLANAWMFDGNAWSKLPPMSVSRDRPACSVLQDDDETVISNELILMLGL